MPATYRIDRPARKTEGAGGETIKEPRMNANLRKWWDTLSRKTVF
jgi:hypothetical protein